MKPTSLRSLPLPAALFLGVLVAVAVFWRLDSVPAGGASYEGDLVGFALELPAGSWAPFSHRPQDTYSNLMAYAGLGLHQAIGGPGVWLRVLPAAFAALAALGLFLLVRSQASAWSAWMATGLLLSSPQFFTYARRFHPGILVVASALLCLAALEMALRRRQSRLYAAAGAMAALGCYAYVPGRVVWVLGLAWIWVLVRAGAPGPRRRDWAALGLTFFLLCAPLAWRPFAPAAAKPATVAAAPARTLHERFTELRRTAERYPKAYFKGSDPCWYDEGHNAPVLDPLAAALLVLGVALALRLNSPLAKLTVGGIVVGLAPAIVSSGFPHPCTRRAILALPFALLAVGLALDALQRWLPQAWMKGRRPWLAGAALLLLAQGWCWTHLDATPNSSITQSMQGRASYLAWQAVKAKPQADVLSWGRLQQQPSYHLYFTGHRNVKALEQPWDLLLEAPTRDQVLLLLPPLSAYAGWYKGVFPGAEVRRHQSPGPASEDGTLQWWGYMDPYLRRDLLSVVDLPLEQARSRQGFALEDGLSVLGRGAASELAAGTRLHAVFATRPGEAALTLSLAQAQRWDLRVDGKAVRPGRLALEAPGLHHLSLRARQAVHAAPLLRLTLAGGAERPLWAAPAGASARLALGKGKERRLLLAPWPAWSEPLADRQGTPLRVAFEARLTPALSGQRNLELPWPAAGRIYLDGKLVFERSADRKRPATSAPVQLRAGQARTLKVEGDADGEPAFFWDRGRLGSLLVLVRSEGAEQAEVLPAEWLRTDAY